MLMAYINLGMGFAQVVKIEAPLVTGTICSSANTSAIMDPDKTTLSVIFDHFFLEYPTKVDRRYAVPQITELLTPDVQGQQMKMVDMHYCNVAFDLVEQNKRIEAVEIRLFLRGTTLMSKNFKSFFKTSVNYDTGLQPVSKRRILVVKKEWSSAEPDWLVEATQRIAIKGTCKSKRRIELKNLMAMSKVINSANDDQALVQLDSVDAAPEGMEIKVITSPCSR
jgi:hypothetical protein